MGKSIFSLPWTIIFYVWGVLFLFAADHFVRQGQRFLIIVIMILSAHYLLFARAVRSRRPWRKEVWSLIDIVTLFVGVLLAPTACVIVLTKKSGNDLTAK
jgi:hypothetical protein